MKPIPIVVISSVVPAPTSAGNVLLHRHLQDEPALSTEVLGTGPLPWSSAALLRRAVGKLEQLGFRRFAADFWTLFRGRWLDAHLSRKAVPHNSIVMTVAHGDAFFAARRFAARHRLPLVTFFHDWWPDIVDVHQPLQARSSRDFAALYQESKLAFCVSPAMKAALGAHENAPLLYPIPAQRKPRHVVGSASCRNQPAIRLLYAGNLADNATELKSALTSFIGETAVRLEVRGGKPPWPHRFIDEMTGQGCLLPFAPQDALETWFNAADAYLVVQSFDPANHRKVRTCFPSKLTEYAQFGMPIVIWGPPDCSAVQWARARNSALCVTNPSAAHLVERVKELAQNPEEQRRLSAEAVRARDNEFSPANIQTQFVESLTAVAFASSKNQSLREQFVPLSRE